MAIKDVVLGYAKGDKGDRGPQGEKGATGAIGPKGDPGNIADAQITDTEGLDVAKGQKTTAQKLFDAIANRIVTKLVTNDALTKKLADYMLKGMMSNTNVNNTGTVPTSALMYSMFEQINNNIVAGTAYFPDATIGNQEILVDFPHEMNTVPIVLVSWRDTMHVFNYMSELTVADVSKTRFRVVTNRKAEKYNWKISYIAICK